MKNLLKKISLVAIACLAFSCSNDKLEIQDASNDGVNFVNNSRAVDLNGYTITNDNEPVSDVTISVGGQAVARSDADGSFRLEGTNVNVGDVLVFEHNDYVSTTKILSEDSKLIISLQKRAEVVRIDPRQKNEIAVGDGGSITIPENSLGLRGEPYNGPINIQATLIDVSDPFQLRSAPGAYASIDEKVVAPLTSFGMIEEVDNIHR